MEVTVARMGGGGEHDAARSGSLQLRDVFHPSGGLNTIRVSHKKAAAKHGQHRQPSRQASRGPVDRQWQRAAASSTEFRLIVNTG